MRFERNFTDHPDPVVWTKRPAKITDEDGKVVFELNDVEAPESWSDTAINIVASKYFKKINGVLETSVKSLIKRVVDQIVDWGRKDDYFDPGQDVVFYDELTYILTNQLACFNSPIWFNFGVPGRAQQGAACFLLGVQDNMESIYKDWIYTEALIFKGGSGSGVNLTPIRHENATLSAGGVASGPMSFLKPADYSAGAIKSGGTTRRAATLRCLDIRHKDIEAFINCKLIEEKKARALIEAGFDGSLNGEVYKTVAYQNMNHSVRVDDEFMRDVIDGRPKAVRLMRMIAEAAWASGDPGIQFDDTINRWHTIPQSGRNTTSNPCGEYLSTDWSSCLLTSINLLKFAQGTQFLAAQFAHVVDIIITALDIIVGNADYPDPRFKETAHNQRQLGLGYANLGAMLMSMGMPYDSDAGRNIAAYITSLMTGEAYLQSSRIAQQKGAFADFQKNSEDMLRVISMHSHANSELKSDEMDQLWLEVLQQGQKYGYRNATTTCCAPTGTIAFMMDCDTTGIESDFALVKYKKLAGGGVIKMVNSTVLMALANLGYDNDTIERIYYHLLTNDTIEGAPALKEEHLPIFDCSLPPSNGHRCIDYMAHVAMVAATQPFYSMGISKTVNMPENTSVDDIYNLYIKAWTEKIKSITIYRDNSKASQPLTVAQTKTKEVPMLNNGNGSIQQITVSATPARKRLSEERKSVTHKMEIAGFEGYLTVGLYEDGSPGEIFINASKQGSTVSGLLDTIAILLSFSLQYGVPLESLVEKLRGSRFEPAGFTKNSSIPMVSSVIDYIMRWLEVKFPKSTTTTTTNGLGSYTPSTWTMDTLIPGTTAGMSLPLVKAKISGQMCITCGSQLVWSGTCHTCPSCGQSFGGCG